MAAIPGDRRAVWVPPQKTNDQLSWMFTNLRCRLRRRLTFVSVDGPGQGAAKDLVDAGSSKPLLGGRLVNQRTERDEEKKRLTDNCTNE